jgi:hypothetical protein
MEEMDLTGAKWAPGNELYLISITESIRENYPEVELEDELKEFGYILDDLLDSKKISLFMKRLNEKYPD